MPANYIICTTQRSGSSYLCECLRRSQRLGDPAEWLVFLEDADASLSPAEIALKNGSLRDAIRTRSEEQRATGVGLYGWKIMWSTMETMARKLKRECALGIDLQFLNEAFEAPRFVYYQRENKVSQAISHAILTKSGIAHVRRIEELKTLESRKSEIFVSNDDITKFLKKLLLEERAWESFFYRNGISPLRINYEETVGRVGHVVRLIANHVDSSVDEAALREIAPKVQLRKTRSSYEADLARRYLESMLEIA